MSNNQNGLSREFVIKSILKLFDEIEQQQKWGEVSVKYQNGRFRVITKQETIVSEITE